MQLKKKHKRWGMNDFQLLFLALMGLVFLLIFCYLPMFGIILAFKDGDGVLNILDAILKSDWVGFKNFANFFKDPNFSNVLINTISLNLLQLLINFPAPIIFALLLNECPHKRYRKTIQSISYMPYFLSWAVYAGIVLFVLDPDMGILNNIMIKMGIFKKSVNFGEPQYFYGVLIISSIVKGVGWGAIVYIAAISNIDQTLYEAAEMDGAGRWRKMTSVTLPSISSTITMFFILSIANLLNNGFEAIYMFQNQINLETSEVLDTFIYKNGLALQQRYSYTTAIGLFKSVVSFVLLASTHFISKKLTGKGVF